MFSKSFLSRFPRVTKTGIVWWRVKTFLITKCITVRMREKATSQTKSYWCNDSYYTSEKLVLCSHTECCCCFSTAFPPADDSFCLTLSQTTNFELFQTERICRRQFKIGWHWLKGLQMGRKPCGKRRYCSLRAISPFPTGFSIGLFPRGVKRCHCVEMG